MKKSLVSLLLLVVMMINIFATFTSCLPGTPVDDNYDGVYDGSAVTITFWHTMGSDNKTLLENAIARFREIYPNIKVDHTSLGDYDEVFSQIRTKLTAGKQPNIAYCYPDHVATYNKSYSVVTLDQLINNQNVVESSGETMGFTQAQLDDFIEGYYNEGKEYGDGKMYSLPFMKSTEVLYYNKTIIDPILAELGIGSLNTWENVEKVILKLKEAYPNSTPLGYDSEENFFITLAAQNGNDYTSATGDHYTFVNDGNKAFVAKFAEWYQKGWMTTSALIGGSYTSDAFKKANDEIGKTFMSIGSSAGARYQRPDKVDGDYPFDVGIIPVPQVDASNPKVISQGPSLCIFKDSNPQEVVASWLFVKFLTTDVSFQAAFSMKSGYAPVIKSVQTNEIYKKWLDGANGIDNLTAMSVKVALSQEKAYFVSPAFSASSEARDQVGIIMQKVLVYEGQDVDAFIDKAFKDAIAECEYALG